MDEPTSGLDSAIAFDVLTAVRELVRNSKGHLSVILTIHQPNSKILNLFDHILLLESSKSTFFGTTAQARTYFSSIGYPCPQGVTATDYYLQITDSNFVESEEDFERKFKASAEFAALKDVIATSMLTTNKSSTVATVPKEKVSPLSQLYTLIYRDFTLAYRDPTLYYFQFFMIAGFAFCVGAVFFQLPFGIDGNVNLFSGGIVWLSLLNGWVHAFKVYHLNAVDRRMKHELANNKYSPLIAFLADTISSATLMLMFAPLTLFCYFMMGFPASGYPFLVLNFWMVRFTYLADCLHLFFDTSFIDHISDHI